MPRVRLKTGRKGRLVKETLLGGYIILIPTSEELASDQLPTRTYHLRDEYDLELTVAGCVLHGFGSGQIMATIYLSDNTKATISIHYSSQLQAIKIGTTVRRSPEGLEFDCLEPCVFTPLSL